MAQLPPTKMTVTPFIIPVFIPHLGCPRRCVFCNQRAITGVEFDPEKVPRIIERALESPKREGRRKQVAFFGGSFSALPMSLQQTLLDMVEPYLRSKEIDSVRISTRPDTLGEDELLFLKERGVSTIELGVQSLDPAVLELSKRGHTAQDTMAAAEACKTRGFEVGFQLMVGLPGDSRRSALLTARKTAEARPRFARIYPTLALRGSELGDMFQRGEYLPLSLREAVDICAEVVDILESGGTTVIRVGLQDSESLSAPGEVLAGPHHPAFGEMVRSRLWLKKVSARLRSNGAFGGDAEIHVAPGELSKARGQKSQNVKELCGMFGFREVRIVERQDVPSGEARIAH